MFHLRDGKIENFLSPQRALLLRGKASPGTARRLDQVMAEAMKLLSYSVRQNHPRKFSSIPGPTSPVSKLGGMQTSLSTSSRELGPRSLDRHLSDTLVTWLATQVGLPALGAGLFVPRGFDAESDSIHDRPRPEADTAGPVASRCLHDTAEPHLYHEMTPYRGFLGQPGSLCSNRFQSPHRRVSVEAANR